MTSWEPVHNWYDKQVGNEGHYYHQTLVMPSAIEFLQLKKGDRLLDVGCGQGVLSRAIPLSVSYTGIDISKALVHHAKSRISGKKRDAAFFVADMTKPLPFPEASFSHAICMLSLQNVKEQARVLLEIARLLEKGGVFVAVLNHPAFRIPRQTSWGYDEKAKVQYRRLDRYMSPLEIPILMHPGKKDSVKTISYHYPLSYYINALGDAGFGVDAMHELCSDKKSEGGRARAENRARQEFPLFLVLRAVKN